MVLLYHDFITYNPYKSSLKFPGFAGCLEHTTILGHQIQDAKIIQSAVHDFQVQGTCDCSRRQATPSKRIYERLYYNNHITCAGKAGREDSRGCGIIGKMVFKPRKSRRMVIWKGTLTDVLKLQFTLVRSEPPSSYQKPRVNPEVTPM